MQGLRCDLSVMVTMATAPWPASQKDLHRGGAVPGAHARPLSASRGGCWQFRVVVPGNAGKGNLCFRKSLGDVQSLKRGRQELVGPLLAG